MKGYLCMAREEFRLPACFGGLPLEPPDDVHHLHAVYKTLKAMRAVHGQKVEFLVVDVLKPKQRSRQ